jgi:hypothetical protein
VFYFLVHAEPVTGSVQSDVSCIHVPWVEETGG